MAGTKQRALIREIVQNSYSHLTAEEVFEKAKEKMPGIVLATVYNNLNALYANGEIGKVYKNTCADRYDKSPIRHAHLICEKCGCVEDLQIMEIDSIIETNINRKISDYEINIRALCNNCLNSE